LWQRSDCLRPTGISGLVQAVRGPRLP
jgi:hypothetical protein